ncbi:MAG TPA: hypothetical protein VLA34_02215 [Candidatus Krumholzibacterium sp.]|nr:hypothetical protein [Candidatus Krumholzibacterium sp.]
MHRGRTSRGLRDVSHLFLSESARPDSGRPGPAEAVAHVAVTGRGLCRAYIGCGLARAASDGELNVTLVETGLSLPNSGYYFGLEPEEYLSVYLGRTGSVSGSSRGTLYYDYSPRPSGLSGSEASFARPDRPHLIINLFDSTSLSAMGVLPARIIELPDLYRLAGHESSGADLLVVFSGGEEVEDVPSLIGSFLKRAPGAEVLVAAGRSCIERLDLHSPDDGTARGFVEIPEGFQDEVASRRMPSGSFFSGLVSRVLAFMSSRERRAGAAAEG